MMKTPEHLMMADVEWLEPLGPVLRPDTVTRCAGAPVATASPGKRLKADVCDVLVIASVIAALAWVAR